MSPRIICSQAVKSAITPSRKGRIVRILGCSFSYIIFASPPTAIILSVRRSRATTDGSSTTILSSLIMIVFAVPRSIAISWINENNPINICVFCKFLILYLICLFRCKPTMNSCVIMTTNTKSTLCKHLSVFNICLCSVRIKYLK